MDDEEPAGNEGPFRQPVDDASITRASGQRNLLMIPHSTDSTRDAAGTYSGLVSSSARVGQEFTARWASGSNLAGTGPGAISG